MGIPGRVTAFLLLAVFVFVGAGCATFHRQEDLKTQGLRNQVSALETQLAARDDEIRDLRGQLAALTEEKEASSSSEKKVIGEVKSRPNAKQIQIALSNAGYSLGTIDGKIGKKTKNAIKAFQREKGLVVDGKVGKQTWSALRNYLYKKVK